MSYLDAIWDAGVAQVVEQGFCKPQVRGSSPCAGTTSAPTSPNRRMVSLLT